MEEAENPNKKEEEEKKDIEEDSKPADVIDSRLLKAGEYQLHVGYIFSQKLKHILGIHRRNKRIIISV